MSMYLCAKALKKHSLEGAGGQAVLLGEFVFCCIFFFEMFVYYHPNAVVIV